jgi:hypothetical protein
LLAILVPVAVSGCQLADDQLANELGHASTNLATWRWATARRP